MKSTLQTIQTVAKIAQIVCRVAMVIGIVVACLCLVGGISAAVAGDLVFKVGNVNIHGLVHLEEDMAPGYLFCTMFRATLLAAGSAVVAGFAGRYFKHEQEAGTPFTMDGAKEMMRLGILTAVVPVVCVAVSEIVDQIAGKINSTAYEVDMTADGMLVAGLLMIVISLLLRYGAEAFGAQGAQEQKTEAKKEEE